MADKQSRELTAKLHTREKAITKGQAKALSTTVKIDVDISEALTGLKAIQREAKKATQELKALEITIQTQRPCGWEIIQASKSEGADFEDLTTFAVGSVGEIDGKIEELRKEGYRFFYVFKSVGVVDDVLLGGAGE